MKTGGLASKNYVNQEHQAIIIVMSHKSTEHATTLCDNKIELCLVAIGNRKS
jgi:hypothetical protein